MSEPNSIESHDDYIRFLEADREALGIQRRRPHWFGDDIWKFQRLLRKLEYYLNCKGGLSRLYRFWLRVRFRRESIRLGFFIPPNVFGPGLSIAHYGSITVNPETRVGKNCRLHICVNIGTAAGKCPDAPVLGDDVYIGPGAKIFGGITIADGVMIGANSVVNRSVETQHITVAGAPARPISEKGRRDLGESTDNRDETPDLKVYLPKAA